jgi:hypothetical protein
MDFFFNTIYWQTLTQRNNTLFPFEQYMLFFFNTIYWHTVYYWKRYILAIGRL